MNGLRRLAPLVWLGVLLAGLTVSATLAAGVASAHATRVATDPADNAVVASGPATVSATFNERLQTAFAAMTVVGPDETCGRRVTRACRAPSSASVCGPSGQSARTP